MENRFIRLLFRAIVLNGTIVHPGMLSLEHFYHLGACPNDGTISVSGIDVDRTIVVEGGVECHSGTYAGAVYLALVTNVCAYGMPTQLGYRTVGHGVNPAFVDGVGKTINVDGRGGRLQIGIVAVE